MAGTVRARVGRGVLELLEKVELPEGTEVSVTILETPAVRDFTAFDRAAGSWKGTIDADTFLKTTRKVVCVQRAWCPTYDDHAPR